jgi:hypothetical protein
LPWGGGSCAECSGDLMLGIFIQREPAFDEPTGNLSARKIDCLIAIIGRRWPGFKIRSVCSG